MNSVWRREVDTTRLLHWLARISATAVVGLLAMMALGGGGGGPSGWREWTYLAFFPVAFSSGYLIGWLRPLVGGSLSLVSMVVSLVVLGRVFAIDAYVTWAVLSVPGVIYVFVGVQLRRKNRDSETVST